MTPKVFIAGLCLLASTIFLIMSFFESDNIKAEHNYTRFCIYSAALFVIIAS